jgi:hypothetical protein
LDVDDVRLSARKGVLCIMGKGEKLRELPIHPQLRRDLTLWLEERQDWPGADSTPALFLNQRGGRLSARGASDVVAALAEAASQEDETTTRRVELVQAGPFYTDLGGTRASPTACWTGPPRRCWRGQPGGRRGSRPHPARRSLAPISVPILLTTRHTLISLPSCEGTSPIVTWALARPGPADDRRTCA